MTKVGSEIRDKFESARRWHGSTLVDRDEEIDLVLTALLAKEHVLLVGAARLRQKLAARFVAGLARRAQISALLTRFSVPEELFGPVSLARLKEDRYVARHRGQVAGS